MIEFGTVRPGSTLYIPFDSFAGSTGASITLSGLAASDIEVYKAGSTTQRASDSGYALLDTDGIDFDGITGIHGFSINLADNATAGFWAAGSRYFVVVSSVTIDGQTVSFVAATFDIGYPAAFLNTTIATLSSQTSFTLTDGPAEDDALNGMWVLIHDVASAVQVGWAQVLDYVGSTKTVTLVAGTTFTAAASDNISVMGVMPLQATTLGRTLTIETDGMAHADVKEIEGSDATNQIRDSLVDDATRIDASALNTASVAIGSNGSGLTEAGGTGDHLTAVPWNAAWDTEVQSEVEDALVVHRLDELLNADSDIDGAAPPTVGSVFHELMSKTAGSFTFDQATDSLEAVRDKAADIEADTQDIQTQVGVDGAGLTNLPWNAAWDTEVESEATDALNAYDPPTRTEATSDKNEILGRLRGLILANGTIGATGNDTTHLHLDGLTYGDDEINGYYITVFDNSTGEYHVREITDWVLSTELATVATLPFTPEASVDGYYLLSAQAAAGGSAPTAAAIADAVWDEALSGHATAGSYGKAVADIEADVDAILVDTSTTLQAELDGIQADTEDIQSRLPAALTGDGNIKADVLKIEGADPTDTINAQADLALSDYDPPTRAELTTDVNSILSKLLKYVQLVLRKDSAIATDNATELTAINANGGSGGGTFANTTDSQEALRDRGDAAWVTATGFSTLDAAGVRSAVGLASANLDTQLAEIEGQTDDIGAAGAGLTNLPWNAAWDTEVQSEVADALGVYDPPTKAELDAAVAPLALESSLAVVDGNVDAVLADTGTDGVVVAAGSKTGYRLSATGIQDIWDAATSALTTIGSIGKLLVDNINATISSRLPTSSYTAPLDAAGTRSAVGLASANLDTQIGDIPTNAELATALASADDATLAAIAALNNLSAAQVNAEVVDALNVDTYPEPAQGAPPATASIVTKIGYLYKGWRNRTTQTATEYALYADDGVTKDQEAAVSDNGTTFERGEVGTGA